MNFRKYFQPVFLLWSLTALLFLSILSYLVTPINQKPATPQSADAGQASKQQLLPSPEDPQAPNVPKAPTLLPSLSTNPSRIDGLPIDEDFEESAVSVMIDNHQDARPQHSGIRSASVVYEALAEGGITRLMLVFPYQESVRVGPIRSAREYFVDYASEYGGLYLHAGGAPSALEKLRTSKYLYQLDEDDPLLSNEPYSFRDPRYSAPHNLFVNLLLARERAKKLNWKLAAPRKSWCFEDPNSRFQIPNSNAQKTGNQPPSSPANQLTLSFSFDPLYDVSFQYDESSRTYKRFFGKTTLAPDTDQLDGLQVAPTNIVVMVAPSGLIPDDEKKRITIKHLGKGKAFFFTAGTKRMGRWEKDTESSPTLFTDENGSPICLNPGQTWVAVVDSGQLVTSN